MECLASGHRSSLVSPLFFSCVVVFVCRGSGGGSKNRLSSLMNLLISISGLFAPCLTLLLHSTIARHKLVTLCLVQGLFSFFALPWSVSLRQVAILEMLFLNVLKASVVRWMLSQCGCFLYGLAYTCPWQRWSYWNDKLCLTVWVWVCAIWGHWRCWVTPSQGGQGAADKCLCSCVCMNVCVCLLSSTTKLYHMSHAQHVFPYKFVHTSTDRGPCQQKWAQHIPKRSAARGKWEATRAGTGSLLGLGLTSTVGASTPDPVHLIPPMMSKG